MGTGLLNNMAAVSLTGWFFQTAPQPANRIGLWGQNDAVEFGFIDPNTIQFWTPNGGSVNATYNQALNNTWVHVAGVANGTDIRIYINGALVATAGTTTTNYGSSADPFRIGGGGIFDTTGNFFTGRIDEVAVFGRALSAAEVQTQFLAAVPEPAHILLAGAAAIVWASRRRSRTCRFVSGATMRIRQTCC
jgi:hypothetical protein